MSETHLRLVDGPELPGEGLEPHVFLELVLEGRALAREREAQMDAEIAARAKEHPEDALALIEELDNDGR